MAKTVDFRIETPHRIYAPFNMRDYEPAHGNSSAIAGDSTEEIKVFGAFIPADHDVFYGCTMMPGSTINLKNRTEEGKMPFHLTCAMTGDSANSPFKSVRFVEESTITVDISALDVKTLANEYLLTWDSAPDASVKFVMDKLTEERGYALKRDAQGVKLISSGLKIIVR